MTPVDTSKYDEIINRVNKKYEGRLRKGNDIENPKRLSTGSLELDIAMGGGAPWGRWTRLYGPSSSTKTHTAWSIIRSAQELGFKCVYYNVEKQYDPIHTAELGVNVEDLDVFTETTIEAIGEVCASMMGVAHVHVIDSCTFASSEDKLAADIRDWLPGIDARAWGKAFDHMQNHFDEEDNMVILIDQVRMNFATHSEQPAGGKASDHASSMSVAFRKGGWLYYDEDGFLSTDAKQEKTRSNQTVPAGRIIQARVEKSRVSRPLLPATMYYDLNKNDYDRTFELMKVGQDLEIITGGKGGNYRVDDKLVAKSKKELRQYLQKNWKLATAIRKRAMETYLRHSVVDVDEDE